MENFVNYQNYQIVLTDSTTTFGIIFIIFLIIIGITCRRRENRFFDIATTTSLRGVAVFFLLFGHLSIKCLQDKMFFNLGGYWAVIIFLFISGYGLYQEYQLSDIKSGFWEKRISKLYVPIWITLVLFVLLDYFLINLHHSLSEIILNFLGFHLNDMLVRVNAVAWFVEYIMVLYFIYWIVSKLSFSDEIKLIFLFCLCFFVHIVIYLTPIRNYHSIWLQYTIVFPTGVLFGKYHNGLQSLFIRKFRNRLFLLTCESIVLEAAYNQHE
jgi:peptidoglycan/LPS O-acetylase OafA/YrhL